MDRKYIHKNAQLNESDDPLSATQRKIKFQRRPADGSSEIPEQKPLENTPKPAQPESETKCDIDDSKVAELRTIQLKNKLKFMQGEEEFFTSQKEINVLGNEFEADKIGQEVSGLLFQYEKQKMMMAQRQIQEERALVQELNQKVEQNISKFISLEARLKEKQAQLEDEVRNKSKALIESEKLAAIGNLASRLAHDLKNPLSVLNVITELLKAATKDQSDPTFQSKLEAANAAIFRMTHQIDNVLDFVKEADMQVEPTSIYEILKLAMSKIPEKNDVVLDIQQNDMTLNCDKQKMAVVFSNIMLNSIQAMNNEGKITIRFYQTPKDTIIDFEDTGPGIPQNILHKIFDPLFTTKQQGTGLGLATCKNIIQHHGGNITVSNNPTKFTVTIPR
ncbi:MAG TPA: ATP-binding protein [Candidatus Nitrosotenuis sp.]|jgi:signal transduction histidine kinase|nr:ATP-binding protein [Candidatus Nitrosotenuis sp.]